MIYKKFINTTIQDFLTESKNSIILAPNGNRSNLPRSLYEYVRTDEFKKWFGDWENDTDSSSKIVDENGEPMLVYHGTNSKFTQFDQSRQKNGWLGKGFYFTNDRNNTKEHGKFIFKVFLNIRNPFVVSGDDPNDINREVFGGDISQYTGDVSVSLRQQGYDGVIFNHWDKGNMISCFDTNQIDILPTP